MRSPRLLLLVCAAACSDPQTTAPDASAPGDAILPRADAAPRDASGGDDLAAPDVLAPDAAVYTVDLSASATTARDQTPIVLTATPLGDTSTVVDFFDQDRRVASDTSAPFTASLAFTAADNGAHRYTARASAASGAKATSAVLEVWVDLPRGTWVDPVNGLDTNPGTASSPFQTIRHAASVSQAGETIFLLDGVYGAARENFGASCLAIPPGVGVAAVNPGQARLQGPPPGSPSCGLLFTGNSALRGVALESFTFALQFRGGTTAVRDTTVTDCETAFEVSDQGRADIEAPATGALVSMARNSGFGVAVALVDGMGELTLRGGSYQDDALPGSAVILVRGGGNLILERFSFRNNARSAVRVSDNGRATLRDVLIDGTSPAGLNPDNSSLVLGAQNTASPLAPSLRLERSRIINSPGGGILVTYYSNLDSQIAVSLTDSEISGSLGSGVVIDGAPANVSPNLRLSLMVQNSTISGNGQLGIRAGLARLEVHGGRIAGNSGGGISIGSDAAESSLLLRRVELAGNGGDTIVYGAGTTAGCDLGAPGAAGLNRFSGVAATALRLATPIGCTAGGDVWLPSIQGADAQGLYPAGLVNGPANGQNFSLVAGASLAF